MATGTEEPTAMMSPTVEETNEVLEGPPRLMITKMVSGSFALEQ